MYAVPAVTATGDANVATCHPEAVSPLNVTVARRTPVALHRLPFTALPPDGVNVKVIDAGDTASENVAVTTDDVGTPVAPEAGLVAVTVGGLTSESRKIGSTQ